MPDRCPSNACAPRCQPSLPSSSRYQEALGAKGQEEGAASPVVRAALIEPSRQRAGRHGDWTPDWTCQWSRSGGRGRRLGVAVVRAVAVATAAPVRPSRPETDSAMSPHNERQCCQLLGGRFTGMGRLPRRGAGARRRAGVRLRQGPARRSLQAEGPPAVRSGDGPAFLLAVWRCPLF